MCLIIILLLLPFAATQIQYLYLPHDVSAPDALTTVKPVRGLVLNITQFDGIPMADVFKVGVIYYGAVMSCSLSDAMQ
jgi:hypothetical protein